MRNDTRAGRGMLWTVVVFCIVYLVLWACGIRFPRPLPPQAKVQVEDMEEQVEPIGVRNFSNKAFDVELPREQVVVDDGRDPDAPLL